MDVEVIEEEPQDALEISEGEVKSTEGDKQSAEFSNEVESIEDVEMVPVKEVAENKLPPKADAVVEWLDDSDEWSDGSTWPSSCSDDEKAGEVKKDPQPRVMSSSIRSLELGNNYKDTAIEKKTEGEDSTVDKDASAEEEPATTSSTAAPHFKSSESKLSGSKLSLAHALLKAAKTRAIDKKQRELAMLKKLGKKSIFSTVPNLSGLYNKDVTVKRLTPGTPENVQAKTSVTPIVNDKQIEKHLTKGSVAFIKKKEPSTRQFITVRHEEPISSESIAKQVATAPNKQEIISKIQMYSTDQLTVKRLKISNPDEASTSAPLSLSPDPFSEIKENSYQSLVRGTWVRRPSAKIKMRRQNLYFKKTDLPEPSTSRGTFNPRGPYRPRGRSVSTKSLQLLKSIDGTYSVVPQWKDAETPETFQETYIRSKQVQGDVKGAGSHAELIVRKQIPGLPGSVQKTEEASPARIRVKTNAELFSNTSNFNEDLFTATSRSDSTFEPLELNAQAIDNNAFRNDTTLKVVKLQTPTLLNPVKEKTPEPEKYVIPQDMLMSSTEKIKKVDPKPEATPVVIGKDYNFSDMFVMEPEAEEEKKIPAPAAAAALRHKRKSSIVPKEDDNIQFDESPFQMIPRPQENIDLIENLANYRVLVTALLKKLDIPPIDFDEDSDDYINLYKIYRH